MLVDLVFISTKFLYALHGERNKASLDVSSLEWKCETYPVALQYGHV